ncbi:MAG: hydroxymethylglutaryl-CoA reductase, degradative [Caldilineaceae bacterium]
MGSQPPAPSGNYKTSRLSGFYRMSIAERLSIVTAWADLTEEDQIALAESLSLAEADHMIENVVGRFALPLGIGTNFLINDRDYLVPMVVEESSVVAAVSFAARLARAGGGFHAGSSEPIMVAQVQLIDVPDREAATVRILSHKEDLLALANTSPSISARGGGPIDIIVRELPVTPTKPMLVVHLMFDVRDAMGANAINTAAEAIAPRLEQLSGGRSLLRILSNFSDRRTAWASVRIPAHALATEAATGEVVASAIADANAFAVADPYRAATHNKGIMNGIDAVAVATGNDWRALEAGAHAYAARDGSYRALTDWHVETDDVVMGEPTGSLSDESSEKASRLSSTQMLCGHMELPLAVGAVGGATKSHPTARAALKILGVQGARELAEVMASVGLAQNLAALRALVTDGIQKGHMALHARQVAVSAGATPAQVEEIAARLVQEGQIREERARQLLDEMA